MDQVDTTIYLEYVALAVPNLSLRFKDSLLVTDAILCFLAHRVYHHSRKQPKGPVQLHIIYDSELCTVFNRIKGQALINY